MNLERTLSLEESCAEPQPWLLAAQAAGLAREPPNKRFSAADVARPSVAFLEGVVFFSRSLAYFRSF